MSIECESLHININVYHNHINYDKMLIDIYNNKAKIIQKFYKNYIKNNQQGDEYYYLHTDEEHDDEREKLYDNDYYKYEEYERDERDDYWDTYYEREDNNEKLYDFTDDWETYWDSIYN